MEKLEIEANQMWKSLDCEYVYAIDSINHYTGLMEVRIFDADLNTIASRERYSLESFDEQVNLFGNIVPYGVNE